MDKISVYRHIRLDTNEVFYIGIGKEDRPYSTYHRSAWWKKIANKTKHRVDVLFNDMTWDQACEKEIELIKLYGRRDKGTGTLVNMTDGGEGTRGLIFTKLHRSRMSKALKGKPLTEETKRKISETLKGHINSKEARAKISKALTGKKRSIEACESISKGKTGVLFSKDHKKKLSEAAKTRKRYPMSEETKRKISESRKRTEKIKKKDGQN